MQNFARERFLLQAQDILISSVAKPRLQSSRHSDSKTFTHHHQILRRSDINQNFETFLALQKKNKKTQLWDPWNATEILRDPRFFKDHLLVRRYYLIWLKFSELRFKISIFGVEIVRHCGSNAWGLRLYERKAYWVSRVCYMSVK